MEGEKSTSLTPDGNIALQHVMLTPDMKNKDIFLNITHLSLHVLFIFSCHIVVSTSINSTKLEERIRCVQIKRQGMCC